MAPEPASPRVLISYSHDSPEHEARVLALADRLRDDGIDAVLDQYESFPPQGWIQWMNQQVLQTQFVLMVCTETYHRRAAGQEKAGAGLGATHESQLIQQLLYNAAGYNEKFVPVVFAEEDRAFIPIEWQRYTHYLVSESAGYEQLYRLLTNQPAVTKPALGRLRALARRQAKADFRNLLWNVPPRNRCFTGRETYLEGIQQALAETNAAALSGIGGIGKTETAAEYAHRRRADYQSVLWSGADVNAPLVSGFAALAHVLEIPGRNEKELSAVARGVRRWLELNSGWLLILDNIDTVEDLLMVRQLVPLSGAGHLLLTTRLHATGGLAKLVELDKMEPEEGALFLLRRAGIIARDAPLDAAADADRTIAERISREVAGLPLALDQAGAFIEETPSTPAEYLRLYQTEGARLRRLRGEMAAGHASVTVTFSLAFSKLSEKNPAAADLLRACAFLAPDAIPEEIFIQGGVELGERLSELAGKPLDFAEALRDAGKFALIRRNATAKNLDMHRQVQEVLKDEMDQPTRALWAERVVAALAKIFPSPEFRNWKRCEELLPHARAASIHVADFGFSSESAGLLLNQTAFYLDGRGEYTEAEPLYQHALAICEKALGPDHPNTSTSLNNLALLYYNQGRYEQAEPLYMRAIAVKEKVLGPDHPSTATSLNNLAGLYDDQGRYEQAEPLYQRALAISEKVLGPDHPNTANSLNNLALLYRNQGRYEQAEPLYQRALAICEKALGPDHPTTANSLNNLALLYDNQGRYEQAEPLHLRALAIREKALGPDHPDTANSLNNLALLYANQRRYEQAEPLYQRALAIRGKALGPDHPNTATSLNNLAELYRNQGRYEQAEPLYQRALAMWEKALGPDHPKAATGVNNLALLYNNQGRHEQSEPLYRRALAIREKALGPDHPDTAASLTNLAAFYDNQGRYEQAEPLYRRALAIREKALGPDHPDTATSLNNLAVLYDDQGRYEQAEPLYRRVLAIREKALGPDHPSTAAVKRKHAEVLKKMGRGA